MHSAGSVERRNNNKEMKIMSNISSKLGVKTLISSAISFGGGGGVFRTPLTSQNERSTGRLNACFCYVENSKSTPNNNKKPGFFAYAYNTS